MTDTPDHDFHYEPDECLDDADDDFLDRLPEDEFIRGDKGSAG